MTNALRAVASVLMLAWMTFVLGVLAAVTVVAVTTALVVAFRAGGGWAAGAGVVLAAAAIAVFLFERGRRRTRRLGMGVPISTREQPLFWVEIYRVAEGLGTRAPDELRLYPDTTAAASERRTWLGLRPGVRSLRLGLPLLAGLTERELRVVMAHEFAQSWGPLSTARVLQRGRETMGRIASRLGEGSLVARIVGWYGRKYVAVSSPITSSHELATDRLCADLAGNNATAAALAEIDVLSKGWVSFVEGYVEPSAAVGARPEEIFAGFECFLQEPGRRTQLADHGDVPAGERWWAYASALTLGERLDAVASLPDDDMHDKSGPAMGLMRHPDHVIRRVEESMFPGLERPRSGTVSGNWEDIVPDAARAAARQDAVQLARLGVQGGLGSTMSVANLLELMSFGLVDEMVHPTLAGGASPEVDQQTAGRLVTGFFATAAIEAGTASFRFSWASPRQLVDDHGAVDDLPLIVDSALAEGNDLSALKLWLKAHHVDDELEPGADIGPALHDNPTDNPTEDPTDNPADDGSNGEPAPDHRSLLVPGSRAAST